MATRRPIKADVLIIGAGICGAAAAYELVRRGLKVVVLDKEVEAGCEGSGRSFGSIRLQGRHPSEIPLMREAMTLWKEAASRLGEDFEFVQGGNLYIATQRSELDELEAHVATAHANGLPEVQLLSAQQIRERLPAVRGTVAGGMYSPYDAHCHPKKATQAFLNAAVRSGAQFLPSTVATRLETSGGRVSGVVTARGTLNADQIVVAAGAWARQLLRGCRPELPIKVVAYSCGATAPVPRLFRETIRSFQFSCRQAVSGEVWFSAGLGTQVVHTLSLDDLRDLRIWLPRLWRHRRQLRLRVDLSKLARELMTAWASNGSFPVASEPPVDRPLLKRALSHLSQLIPDLESAVMHRVWAGLVDLSPDALPILGKMEAPAGITVVAGLSGHGLALAPVLGRIVGDLVVDGKTPLPIRPFRPSRFREESVEMPHRMI